MESYLPPLRFVALTILVIVLSGCDPKCWPICSSSSSGVADSSTTTTDTTTDTTADTTTDTTTTTTTTTVITPSGRLCNDKNATITTLKLSGPNGGESFEAIDITGASRNPISIRWSKTGTGSVCVDLYKSDVFHYRIAGDNDSYKQKLTGMDWSPHASLEESSKYQIKLISPNDSTVTDMSSTYFTISNKE